MAKLNLGTEILMCDAYGVYYPRAARGSERRAQLFIHGSETLPRTSRKGVQEHQQEARTSYVGNPISSRLLTS